MNEDLIYKPIKSKADVNELLSMHKNLVYFMLTKMGKLNDQDCEEAGWDALWDAIERFDVYGDTAFSTFACRCIQNRINDVLRKRQIKFKHETDFTEAETLPSNGMTIPAQIESVETLMRVQKILEQYITIKSGVTRKVLLAWQASKFSASAATIATVCNTTSSTVGKVLVSFRAYLATELRD